MNFDWQTVAVALIVAGASIYVARRALARLRSFGMTKGGGACATGCGKCGGADATVRRTDAPVQIDESGGTGRGRR